MAGTRTDDDPVLSGEELADWAKHLDAVQDGRGDETPVDLDDEQE